MNIHLPIDLTQANAQTNVCLAIAAVVGLIVCFRGYSFWRGVLALAGLAAGGYAGWLATRSFFPSLPAPIQGIGLAKLAVYAAAGAGFVGAFIAQYLVRVGTGLVVAAAVLVSARRLAELFGYDPESAFRMSIAAAIAVGLFAAIFARGVTIILSGILGAGAAATGAFTLLKLNAAPQSLGKFGALPQHQQMAFVAVGAVVMAIAGMIAQFRVRTPAAANPNAPVTREQGSSIFSRIVSAVIENAISAQDR